jgi:hypothetical protein
VTNALLAVINGIEDSKIGEIDGLIKVVREWFFSR